MDDEHKVTDADFKAADDLLSRITSGPLSKAAVQQELRPFYAELHARFGAAAFSLRFGLREPRTPLEELEVSFFKQEISEEEYRERFKAYATRPVDSAMLRKFFDEYEVAVQEYGDVLQLIVQIATDQRDANAWKSREPEIDVAIEKLDAKFDMFSTELMTVSEFLTELQADREHPLKCGDYVGDSVHWIAALVFSHISKAWTNCKDVAHRSRNDPHYLYPTTASALFLKTWVESNKLPPPNDLAAMMRSERAKAMTTFKSKIDVKHPNTGLTRTVLPIHFDDFSGHQFERLVFAYHLRTESWRTLEWYGQGGSDLGRDIWGEKITGDTICIQCVNRQRTTAKKITDDLDGIVLARGGIPTVVRAVCASKSVSAKLRDKVKDHACKKGIAYCEVWSGPEFEERLRHNAEPLLKRFLAGEEFPDDPQRLCQFIASARLVESVHGRPDPHSSVSLVNSNNNGVIANQVTIHNTRSRSHAIILPGSIGSDPDKYNYVEYLIKRLATFREAGSSYGQSRGGKVHPGSTRKILERQLGGLPKDLSVDRFLEVVAHLKEKIDNTALGRNNRKRGVPNYHSFEEHRKGDTGS